MKKKLNESDLNTRIKFFGQFALFLIGLCVLFALLIGAIPPEAVLPI